MRSKKVPADSSISIRQGGENEQWHYPVLKTSSLSELAKLWLPSDAVPFRDYILLSHCRYTVYAR